MNKEEKKIKILWLSNVPPIPITGTNSGSGGWLEGAFNSIKEEPDIEISFIFPVQDRCALSSGSIDGVSYNSFIIPWYLNYFRMRVLEKRILKRQILRILTDVKPDILHVFGTEFPWARIAVECFNKPQRTVIHVQGFVSIIAKHCVAGFPFWARYLFVPSSIYKPTLQGQARQWKKDGKDEIQAIKHVAYVMGRTEWDEACTRDMHPFVEYIHCGETLRPSFYEDSSRWEFESCEKHSIYFSQSLNQVKGLHQILPYLPQLIETYPDAHLYVGGDPPLGDRTFTGALKRSSFGWYLLYLIRKYKLQRYITFLGPQTEHQVVQNLKEAHVFLSASLIENSPNSIGEAMIIGTPVVSSDVGGVKNFISHGVNGFIYPSDEPYMVPFYIRKVFENRALAESLSVQGKTTGGNKYSGDENGEILLSTYKKIAEFPVNA